MKPFWRGIVFVLWFLSQTLGFVLPAVSGLADGAPPRASWEQGQLINEGYDTSSLAYDAEMPPATAQALSDPVGIGPTTLAYDSCSVFPIRVAGSPRARPLVLAAFLAAKTGGQPLFRAVTDAELQSIQNLNRFSTVPGSSTPIPGVQGKWFYSNLEDAQRWAGQAAARDGGPLHIIRTSVPESVSPAWSQP